MKTFLHVGCGTIRKDHTTLGFSNDSWEEIRLDINPDVQPDIVASMTDMRAVADASVDAVYTSHNIEHLYWHEIPRAIKEFYRVLKNDGFLVITCPDIQSICELVAQGKLLETCYISPSGPVAPFDVLFGFRQAISDNSTFMAHHAGFTQKTLVAMLRENGFPTVASRKRGAPSFDLYALATKTQVKDQEIRKLAMQHFKF
ncbi:MAG: class I SAM-dependent methyltransferase [Desulfovibrionaceae bacterium]|nr:class I SAM-dependent methyltransferase [Desulfovibrionaceae bacterium]